jgi:hypothetical protein
MNLTCHITHTFTDRLNPNGDLAPDRGGKLCRLAVTGASIATAQSSYCVYRCGRRHCACGPSGVLRGTWSHGSAADEAGALIRQAAKQCHDV